MTQPTLLVLAAGMGSRYGGLKQMEPIGPGGEALLDYAVFDAKRAGFNRFVFLIRKDIESDFRQVVTPRFENKIDAHYAFQELSELPAGFSVPADRKKPWGTTHAVLCAADLLTGPFAAINADDYYGVESYQILADFFAKPQPAGGLPEHAMVGFQLSKTVSEYGTVARGICSVDSRGLLERVEELTSIGREGDAYANQTPPRKLTGRETVSMNYWGFLPSILEPFRRVFSEFLAKSIANPKAECYLPTAVDQLIREKELQVRVLPSSSDWFGVTYPQDRPLVVESIRKLIKQGVYPERLWE